MPFGGLEKNTPASSLTEGFDKLNCNMNIQDIESILGKGKAWTGDGITNQPLGFVYTECNLKLLYYGDTIEGRYKILDIRLIQIDSKALLKIKEC